MDNNPHPTVASKHQQRFSINIWVEILDDQFVGPVLLATRLTDAVYYRFLVNDLPLLLEQVPLQQQKHMWFVQDGIPPHFLRIVRPDFQ
jgi:hypothetical protein